MAYFIRGTDSKLTPLQHSRDIFKQYLLQTKYNTLMGKKGSGKPIIVDSKSFSGMGTGDTRRFHFIPQVTGKGIRGQNASITGNEKTLDEYYTDIKIDLVNFPLAKKGKMTDKRTIWNFREEAKKQITNWFRIATEEDIGDAMTGYTIDGCTPLADSARDTTPLVNGQGRCFYPKFDGSKYSSVVVDPQQTSNNTLTGTLTKNDVLNTHFLDELQDLCKHANEKYAMAPVRLSDGEEYYLLYIHSRAAVQLRRDPRWEKRSLATMTGHAGLENDPIAKGSLGVWEHIIIKESDYITTAMNTSKSVRIARNLLFGADAVAMCWGQTLDWCEELQDYHTIYGVNASEIRGVKKLTFDGVDLNIAQVPSAIY